MEALQKKRIVARQICKAYFKDDKGDPFLLTDGQADVFNSVLLREGRRQQIIAPTQYGKSESISMALILRSQIYKESWWVLTGEQKKSEIIMSKVIAHLFDHPDLLSALEISSTEPLEKLKRERSRERLSWLGGGEIRAVTADARNRRRVTETLSGFGNENIVADESSLIPDDLQAMVLRMLGGHNGGYLIKIGNPYNRGHFLKSWKSDKYKKTFIDYHQGLKESRYTPEFIEEMRAEPFFDVLYECKFPDETAIDTEGYFRLLTDVDLEKAYDPNYQSSGVDDRLGYDLAEGGDDTAGVKRSKTHAKVTHRSKVKDLMATTGVIKKDWESMKIPAGNMMLDKNGVGAGVHARIREQGIFCVGVQWGEKAESDTFANNKAEHYWRLREWVKAGGKICDRSLLDELRTIKYKEDSSGKLKIKSKEDMRKEGLKSPNEADALAITFEKTVEQSAPKIHTL